MAPLFPAVLIGGPPHSGKSTLAYRLSAALRQRAVAHYVLRASPDGEGDWSHESAAELVAALRMRAKADWTPAFAVAMGRDIAARHLPLLVDAGGKVSPEIEQIAATCTHALLLAADPAALEPWRALAARHGLPVIADLQSALDVPQQVIASQPTLHGTISGLGRGRDSSGVCFQALVDRLVLLLGYDERELYRAHLALTDIELVVHVERAIHPLPAHTPDRPWVPDELPVVLESLPRDAPLAIYGRGPVWLYAGIAAWNAPQRCAVFDVRQGWVEPPALRPAPVYASSPLICDLVAQNARYTHLQCGIPGGYLDYREAPDIAVPPVPPDHGLVLNGKLPNWLWAALVRAYTCAWIAVFQPQTGAALVVTSHAADVPIGSRLALA